MVNIDATEGIVGRIAARAATAALHGENVHIVNVEKAVFSGKKAMVVQHWKRKFAMGAPSKGPFIKRQPDFLMKRIIRGMLPSNARGREALKRITCHIGDSEEHKDAKQLEGVHMEKLPNTRVVSLGLLCKELGGSWHE